MSTTWTQRDDEERIELSVRFTQEITVVPPGGVDDPVEADAWFHNDPERIIRDAVDVSQGTVELLSVGSNIEMDNCDLHGEYRADEGCCPICEVISND